jgi:hypothetical protein
MAETRVVNLEVKDNTKSLKAQLKEAQMEVQALADKYGATSKEAVAAAKRAADLKDRIGDAKALTDAFNPDAKFKALSASLSGVAGGFSAVTGAMGLLGAESEDVQRLMLKVQSAMALSQGLQALGESRDAFKQLGAVAKNALQGIKNGIAATGIGVLLVALGTIVAYWDDIKAAVSGVSEDQKKYNAAVAEDVKAQKAKMDTMDKQDNILKLQGKTEKQITELKIKQIDATITATEAQLKGQKATLKAQVEAEERNYNILKTVARIGLEMGTTTLRLLALPIDAAIGAANMVSEALGYGKITAFSINDEISKMNKFVAEGLTSFVFDPAKVKADGEASIKETEAALLDLKNKKAGYELAIKDIDKKAADDRANIAKDAADKLLKQQEAEAEAARKLREEQNKLIKDDRQRELAENNEQYNQKIEDLKKGKKELNDTDRALIATYEAQRLKDQADINAKYDKLQEEHDAKVLADMKAQDAAQLAAFFEGEKIKIDAMQAGFDKQKAIRELAYKQEVADLAAKLDEGKITQEQYDLASVTATKKLNADIQALRLEDLNAEKAKMEQKQALQQQGMDVALQGVELIKQVFGKSKAVQKGAVVVESAIGIAKMIQANNIANIGALATPQAIATSGAAAAPVIAMNNIQTGIGIAANIAATAKALKEIGAGGSVSAPSVGGGGGGSAGGGGGTMQAPNFNVVGNNGINQLAQLQQQPVKAYVVGAEVTSQQALDRNRISTGQL